MTTCRDNPNEADRRRTALENNLRWFCSSGIMLPADGSWGVAERIAITNGNSSISEMRAAFPAITEKDGWAILEQRRADCNFQLAWLFHLASRLPDAPKSYRDITGNLLEYLYNRSGLLKRTGTMNGYYFPKGSWQWSHITHFPKIYFDDESWCVFLQLELARAYPAFDRQYQMTTWAMLLARELCLAAEKVLSTRTPDENGNWKAPEGWQGRFNLPHWGGLTCMALARSWGEEQDTSWKNRFSKVIQEYFSHIADRTESMIYSELSYLLLACSSVWSYLHTDQSRQLQEKVSLRLAESLDGNGNLPAQHNEAPTGRHLVDLIYTMNWAILALQTVQEKSPTLLAAYRKTEDLLLKIQDMTPAPQFAGCWRGMYDLSTATWGGGDCYEGGAGSIYSGWTNAPIATALAQELLHRHLFSI